MRTIKQIFAALMLVTTISANAQKVMLYKNGVVVKEYAANEIEQVRFLTGQPNVLVEASSTSKKQDYVAAASPKLVVENDRLTFTDNTNSVFFSKDEKIALLGGYSLSLGAQSEDDYYSTFSSSHAVQFADEISVYAVDVKNDRLAVTEIDSKQVPANTGVLIKSSAASALYKYIASATSVENNLLLPSGDDGISASAMDAANTKFYRLTMHNGTQIGFWWGAENGAAFNLAANKAYLAVPSASLAKSFVWFEKDDEDAINVVNADAAKDAIYNLSGQRMNRLQKGINISNNKKIVVR